MQSRELIKKATIIGSPLLGMIASYLNTYLASRVGDSSDILSFYAFVLLVIQTISTFSIYGGSSAFSQNLGALGDKKKRNSFFTTIALLSTLLFILTVIVFVSIPSLYSDYQIANVKTIILLLLLSFFFQFFVSVLPSLKRYVEFSLLFSIVPISFSFFLVFILNTKININYQLYSYYYLVSVLTIASIYSGYLSLKSISVEKISITEFIDNAKKAIYIHLITVLSFLYLSFDQYLILYLMGSSIFTLYFVTLQVGQVARFLPIRLGQLFLSSFSDLIGSGKEKELVKSYRKSAYIVLCSTHLIALWIIALSEKIEHIFPKILSGNSLYVEYVAVTIAIGALGPVNSMLVLALKRSKDFLLVNVTVFVIHLVFFICFYQSIGLMSIYLSKFVSMIYGQFGNLKIITTRWMNFPNDVLKTYLFSTLTIVLFFLIKLSDLPLVWWSFGLVNIFIFYNFIKAYRRFY